MFSQSFNWFFESDCENFKSLEHTPTLRLYIKDTKSSEEKEMFFRKLVENRVNVPRRFKYEYDLYFEIDERNGKNIYFDI